MAFFKTLIFVFCLTVFSGCTEQLLIVKQRDDLSSVVNSTGIPLNITESYSGGKFIVSLLFKDKQMIFDTNEDKSYFKLISSHDIHASGYTQKPIPLWFKVKYPNLNWADIPVK